MKFLIDARCTDEHVDPAVRFAWVDISPLVARTILRRATSFEELCDEHRHHDGQLVELAFADASVRYLQDGVPPLEDATQVEGNGDFATTSWEPGRDQGERTTADVMVITADAVHWRCTLRHSDVDIVTDFIPHQRLAELLAPAS